MSKDKTELTEEEREALLRQAFEGLTKEEMWRLTSNVLRGAIEEDNSAQYVIYTDVYNEESEDYDPSEH